MSALDDLIAAVEAGVGPTRAEWESCFPDGCRDENDYADAHKAVLAFDGSLDAAKALHEALLPGWDFWVWRINRGDYCADVVNADELEFCGKSADNPARAWLLAILRAYRGLQE